MTRRGKGEGGIRKRPDGRWEGTLQLGWRDGKRQRKFVYGKTRQEVQVKLGKARRQLEDTGTVGDDRQTVETFLNRWLTDAAEPTVAPSTYQSYEEIVRLHISPELGRTRLTALQTKDVQQLLNKKRKGGLSPRRVQLIHATLRRALNIAVEWGELPRNPAVFAKPPRVPDRETPAFSKEEATAFMEAIRDDRLEALYVLVLALGLRRGEALALRWDDVDLEAGELKIRHTLQRREGGLVRTKLKTRRSRRTLSIPAFALETLRAHHKRQLEKKLALGAEWQGTGFVFTTEHGGPLDGSNMYRRFQGILKRVGLRKRPFHALRHSAATLMLARGIPLRVIQEILGHSQISLTANLYTGVMPALKKEAAAEMDDLLGGK